MLKRIGFLGAGNMAGAIIKGLIRSETLMPKNIWASAPHPNPELQSEINFTQDNQELIKNSDVVILAVKPQIMQSVIQPLQSLFLDQNPLVMTVAAGLRVAEYQTWLGDKNYPIIRTMPNTPSLVGAGITGLYSSPSVTNEQRKLAENIFKAVGITMWFDHEEMIDTFMSLAGCGPANVWYIMECFQKAIENLGMDAVNSELISRQLLWGTGKMAYESDKSLATLRENVTSPGGATAEGLKVLMEGNLEELFTHTLIAAKNRFN